jgi:hypothetical protein
MLRSTLSMSKHIALCTRDMNNGVEGTSIKPARQLQVRGTNLDWLAAYKNIMQAFSEIRNHSKLNLLDLGSHRYL